MTRVIGSSAQAESMIGIVLGPSAGVLIDQARIDAFADATGDHQWIHVDPVRAAQGPYGATIAHGYLTLSLVPMLAAQLCALDFGTARLNYGLNRVRFPMPVTVGSTLRLTAELTDVRRELRGSYVTTRYTLAADGAAKPACIAETVVLVVGEETSNPA